MILGMGAVGLMLEEDDVDNRGGKNVSKVTGFRIGNAAFLFRLDTEHIRQEMKLLAKKS